MIEVIAVPPLCCVSNAMMKWRVGPGRSCEWLMRPMHSRVERLAASSPSTENLVRNSERFTAADASEKVVQPPLSQDVRQGIASRRRHVAPALLLC
jgi:hypothetical protein